MSLLSQPTLPSSPTINPTAISVATPSTSSTTSSTPTTSTPTSTSAATSPPATTSSSTSSQATSSSSPSSSVTTQSLSSSSSSTTPTTTSSTSITPTPSAITVTNGGTVITTFVTSTPSASNSPSSSAVVTTKTTNSFFSNTGAVAGVFTVAGLIVLVIFVALVTTVVRRRRAKKFDRDVAEAAAEAAASSRSPFDDFPSPGGNTGYPYSDSTHGTFSQPPMGVPIDTYGIREMSNLDPYAAGAASLAAAATVGRARSRQDSESRTPGIAGVGAGNLAREPSRRAPYHAFAGPPPQPHETLEHASVRYRRGAEMLEAAGLSGTGAAAMAAQNGGAYINRRPSQFTQQTHGSMRSQGRTSNENFPQPLQPGYQPPPRNDTQFADAYTGINNNPSSPAFPNPHESTPSFPSNSQHHLLDGVPPLHDVNEDDRMSYADDDDYGQHNRVLRVANE